MGRAKKLGIVLIAVEDEEVLVSHCLLKNGNHGFEVDGDIKYKGINRRELESGGEKQDSDDFTVEKALKIVRIYIEECIEQKKPVDAIGVSIFGNIDGMNIHHISNGINDPGLPSEYNLQKVIIERFPELKNAIITLDNEASAATYGEYIHSDEPEKTKTIAYIRLGRGVNCGLVVNGQTWRGRMQPEMAHFVPRFHDADLGAGNYVDRTKSEEFKHKCAVHHDCLLALTSMRAVRDRLDDGLDKALVTDIYAYYIAQLCHSITLLLSPDYIVVDGRIFQSDLDGQALLDKDKTIAAIRTNFKALIKEYPRYCDTMNPADFILEGQLGNTAALEGIRGRLTDEINDKFSHPR